MDSGVTWIDRLRVERAVWLPDLQDTVTSTFADGRSASVGGAWTPLLYAIWFVGAVLAGRLWRLLPVVRRRRAARS